MEKTKLSNEFADDAPILTADEVCAEVDTVLAADDTLASIHELSEEYILYPELHSDHFVVSPSMHTLQLLALQ